MAQHNLPSPSRESRSGEYREWTDPYNSFNSLKGLLYRDWMEGILKGEFLPPVEASIDPVYSCNLDCVWCNSHGILKNGSIKGKKMTTKHLLDLCRFLGEWGVKGACFAGGGEPLLHEGCAEATEELAKAGVESAFLTNGINLEGDAAEAIVKYSRWVGVSVDSGSRDNYSKIKNIPPEFFDRVVENLAGIVELRNRSGSKLEVSYKFLIHPDNADQILPAAKLAKEIGVDYIHARPAASENILGGADCALDFPMDIVNEQLSKIFELQDENFKVFGIRHKFSPRMTLKKNFCSCLAAPLLIQLGADGNCYLCVDHRGKPGFIIGRHEPDPKQILEFWGGKDMIDFMEKVDLEKCPRCTFGIYNEIMEKVLVEDRMCMSFP
ncbi:MAG: radical SAM protein [Chloroflexi bacterium]|nr:radical SAM protein [Chloroflexota bacterium]